MRILKVICLLIAYLMVSGCQHAYLPVLINRSNSDMIISYRLSNKIKGECLVHSKQIAWIGVGEDSILEYLSIKSKDGDVLMTYDVDDISRLRKEGTEVWAIYSKSIKEVSEDDISRFFESAVAVYGNKSEDQISTEDNQ